MLKSLLGCTTAAGAAILMTVVFASAQERRETKQDESKAKQKTERESRDATIQPGRDPAGRGSSQGDSQLVTWLATDNEGEIEVGKFAASRSENDQVKKFAQHMVDEHTEFLNKLRRMGSLAATTGPEAGTRSQPGRTDDEKRAATRRDETKPGDPTKKSTSPTETARTKPGEDTTTRRAYLDPEGRIDLARIKQEIGRECVETTKKELDEKTGAEFDKCFLNHQIVAHLQVADTLKVMKNHASPELRRLLEEGEKTVQSHLAQAKDILKQLEGETKRPSSKTQN